MMTARTCLGFAFSVLGAGLPAVSYAQAPLMDRQKEVTLALSACPPSVAQGAGVYVLEQSGYVMARESQNGFVAIVAHALPISQEPQCMDAEGTKTHLPRLLKVAELRAQGKSTDEIARYVAEAFAKGIFVAPQKPGVDYMLSSENLPPDNAGKGRSVEPFPPHVMIYAPYATNAAFGVDGSPDGPLMVVGEGTPHALIIIPVVRHDTGHHGGGNK